MHKSEFKPRKFYLIPLILIIRLFSACADQTENKDESNGKTVDTSNKIDAILTESDVKNEYVVISKIGDDFVDLARYFSDRKNATLLLYKLDFSEIMPNLSSISPDYVAIVLSPNELTADFIDTVDSNMIQIDNDEFYDAAIGFITGFDSSVTREYIEKLLELRPTTKKEIYGSPPPVVRDIRKMGFEVSEICIDGFFVDCGDQAAKIPDVAKEIKDKPIVILQAHGNPSTIILNGFNTFTGSEKGVTGNHIINQFPLDKEEIPITLNANLFVAQSCTTARINNKPSVTRPEFLEDPTPGKINESIALSFLKSGALNYIGALHTGDTGIDPIETILPEAILGNVSIGKALKNFKNRYRFSWVLQGKDLPGKPKASNFVRDYVEFQTRNWVLFGDPASIIADYNIQYKSNCVQELNIVTINGTSTKKKVNLIIKFEDESGKQYLQSILYNDIKFNPGAGNDVISSSACAIAIPFEVEIIDYEIEKAEGVIQNEWIRDKEILQSNGRELLLYLPNFLVSGGALGTAKLTIAVETKK